RRLQVRLLSGILGTFSISSENAFPPRVFLGFLHLLRIAATSRVYPLRRILRPKCAAFCAACEGTLIVAVPHLQGMGGRGLGRIAQPLRDNVNGMILGEFGFKRSSQVVEQPAPRLDPGLADGPQELRPQVLLAVAVTIHDIDAPFW